VTRFLVALGCLLGLPRVLCAQADTTDLGLRLRFEQPPFTLQQPAALRATWLGAPRLTPAAREAALDSVLTDTLAAARVDRARGLRLRTLYGEPIVATGDSMQAVDSAEAERRRHGVLGLPTEYADLTVDGQARLEIRTTRVREERCTAALSLDPNSGCRGGFKAPSLDNQLNLKTNGLLGRRVHVNVDLDTERDFSANNNIQIYYEGLEDEIIRRVDVGTVVFQPPPSRFISAAVPASNFGVNATFEVGPVQLQTLAATQKGSQVAERTYTVGETTTQAQDRQVRDLDFETGRFFWVADPASVPGYPAVDVLNLESVSLPASFRPAQVRVYRYRAANSKGGVNPNIGGITALARRRDSPQQFGPARWELLIQGTDYYLDQSGLWVVLATKLDQNDYLAVSYRTQDGSSVGTFPEADRGTVDVGGVPQARDTIELIVKPQQGPADPTFRYEMRQVYRVAGADLQASSLQVGITLNRSERPISGNAQTYLQQLGLSIPTDPAVFDQPNRLFPRTQDGDASAVVKDSYIIFPNLQPFADPARLSPEEVSDSLYRTPLFLLTSQGPPAKFALRLQYQATGGGDRTTLSLNALQLREGSEQLYVSGRKLERHVDYDIDYNVGQVTFLNPDALFGSGSAQVTARFEERGLFAVAPTTIFGLSSRYSLGDRGAINLIGLYQREASAFNRPALGFESSANLIGGVNTELHFKPDWLSRALNGLTSQPSTAPSRFDVNAELAFTKPDPNRSGQAYLDEFEGESGLGVSLREAQWEFGSRPQQATGVEDIGFAGGFDPADAVALTWQNFIPVPGSNQPLEFRSQDIDTLIRVAGRDAEPEAVMFLTLHADTAGGIVQRNSASRWTLPRRDFRPRWRSMVTALSPTGLDLTRDEFLEFWLLQPGGAPADSAGLRLVIDIGTVSEDAVAIAPESLTVNGADSIFTGRQYVGQGRLDSERNATGIFNSETDDIGILGDRPSSIFVAGEGPIAEFPLCTRILTSAVPVFPWGDLSARCTNGNGVLDTEDLNGDDVLDGGGPNENVFRYVVDLAADSFYVRDGVSLQPDAQGRVATWKLYRIPIRQPRAVINTPTLRLAQHLRITFATPPDGGPDRPDVVARLAMARLRFIGSPWVRRSETPIAGLTGAIGQPHGTVSVSTISTENRLDLGYESPPGVVGNVNAKGGDRDLLGTQINERALRIIGQDLRAGERAEAYLRLPAGPQNLLTYRTLRVWMRGRGPGWDEGDLTAYVKLGSDNDNFYLYRGPAHSQTWVPEFAIDLETWRRLRADIENRWLTGQGPSGAAECGTEDPQAYVACDGPYVVHVRDPGVNPPNLAAVQEVSAGIYRVGESVTTPEAELWVDDIRLSEPVSATGMAGSVDARLVASDVGSVTLSYTNQNGQFRQINQDPTYRGKSALQLTSNLRLERFLPTSLGLAIPLTISHARTGVSPELLSGSDIRGDALAGLRRPESRSTTINLAVRRSRPGKSWMVKGLVDPFSLTASLTRGQAVTELSEASSRNYNLNLNYLLQMRRRGFRLPLDGLVGALPEFVRESDLGKSLGKATLSLVPTRLSLSSGLSRDEADATAFRFPVARADDAALRPTLALTHLWRNAAGLTWQPLGMLTLSGDLTSTRDLRVYPDSAPIGRLAYAERRFFLGIPVGVERDRSLTTTLALTPVFTSWLRPRFLGSSNFVLSRTLSSRDPVRVGEEGGFVLPQTLNNSRTHEIGAAFDLSKLVRGFAGDSSAFGKAVARIRPLDVSTRLTRGSTYDLAAFDPGLKYQLALGGLEGGFLSQEASPARGASEARTASLTSGADLPFGFTFTLSHALTRTTRFQRVGEGFVQTETRQREFPVGNLRWSHSFRGGALTTLALGTAFRRRAGSSVQLNADGPSALTSISSSSLTPDLQVGFRNGISLTFSLSATDQENLSNGNETNLDQNDITGALNYAFRLPRSISKSRKPVRSSLSYLQTEASSCLRQRTDTECEVISDVIRHEIRGGLDTDLMQTLSGGLQLSYSLNDAKHLSRRTSQISVIASFQLSLFAGDYR
jgi:hypothetical protein